MNDHTPHWNKKMEIGTSGVNNVRDAIQLRDRLNRRSLVRLVILVSFLLNHGTGYAAAPDAVPGKSEDSRGLPTTAASKVVDELTAERVELERQRKVIDEKLANLDARLRGQTNLKPNPPDSSTGLIESPHPNERATQPTAAPPQEIKQFTAHGQTTVITEKHDTFHAPYAGPNSLPRHEGEATSVTATLFLGTRVWNGGEVYFNPEISGGQGFGGVTGLAGFSNGEIPRVGTPEPRPYVARLFLRQTFDLGGGKEYVEDAPNQIAGFHDARRLVVTAGKFGAIDFFQSNNYSNDPRAQFENWALFTNGAWDYPADVRGYTEGAAIEYTEPKWTLRYAAMTEPTQANGGTFDSRIPAALGHAVEFERRYSFQDHPGVVRVMGYANSAHMGNYRQAIDRAVGSIPDVTKTRGYRIKYGFGLSADQEITKDLGIFARLGWNDGHTETWAFTEIDESASLGLSLKGTRWHRADDVVGIAGVLNGLSQDHRDYLRAGGRGFIIGDGRLHYGLEKIVEGYYLIKLADHIFVTADAQYIANPAYNQDRGPVFVGGIRVHIEF